MIKHNCIPTEWMSRHKNNTLINPKCNRINNRRVSMNLEQSKKDVTFWHSRKIKKTTLMVTLPRCEVLYSFPMVFSFYSN